VTIATDSQTAFSGQVPGQLVGMVMDVTEAAIPGASVVVKGLKAKRQIVSDSSGRYSVALPAGVYEVTTEANGFHRSRRALFRIQGGTQTIIDIRLVPSGIQSDGQSPLSQLGYETFATPNSRGERLELLIEFGTRKEHSGIIEYRGASVTHDDLSVIADRVFLDQASLKVQVEGNVVVKRGERLVRVRRATLNFRSGDPTINLTTGAILSVSGEGSIQNEQVRFNFSVSAPHFGHLSYVDERSEISFDSLGIHSFGVEDDSRDVVTFRGIGQVNRSFKVPFTVTVRDGKSGDSDDSFLIEFDGVGLQKFNRQGTLLRGNVVARRGD
jgi:hypothetical protein